MSSATKFQFPPRDGFVVTHFLVVADQKQSRDYFRDVFGAEVVRERDPVILKHRHTHNTTRPRHRQRFSEPTRRRHRLGAPRVERARRAIPDRPDRPRLRNSGLYPRSRRPSD